MYSVRVPLHAIEETVFNRCVISVTDDIKEILNIHNDIYTQFDDRIDFKKNKQQLDNNAKKQSLYVNATEETEPDMELIVTPVKPDMPPIYKDDEVEARITTSYLVRKVKMQCDFYTMSKSEAFAKANLIRTMTSNDSHTWLHDLEYYYGIGVFASQLVLEINNLKNKRLEKPLELEEYINKTFDDRVDLTYADDADMLKTDIVIREAALEVAGYIEGSTYDIEPEFDEQKEQWKLSFTYTFTYDRPIGLYVEYPLLIFNTLIDKRFRRFKKIHNKRKSAIHPGRMIGFTKNIDRFNPVEPFSNNRYLTIPKDDNVRFDPNVDAYSRLFSVLCIVDEDKPKELFNIKDIGLITLRDSVVDFLISEGEYVGEIFKSMFYIELYEGMERCYDNKVIITKNGDLETVDPMNIKKTYRVVVNVLSKLGMLDWNSRKRISEFIDTELTKETVHTAYDLVPVPGNDKINAVLAGDKINGINNNTLDSNTTLVNNEVTDYLSSMYLKLFDIDPSIIAPDNRVSSNDLFVRLETPIWDKMKTKSIYSTICINSIAEAK